MTNWARSIFSMVLISSCISGLMLWAFCLGARYRVVNTEVVAASPLMPALSSEAALTRAAADFEIRHPPLPIPTVFPQAVKFGLGQKEFRGGDDIVITDVHGTSDVFAPGNVYQVKGRYNLSSCDQASMSLYVSSKHASDAVGYPQPCQNGNELAKGQGEFTLILPMRCEGWPHITLHADGKNIGDVYFGSGDSILQ